MAETIDQGPRPQDNQRRSGANTARLLQSLKQAHEADHEVLDALGIKHPHNPMLDVVELLDHLKDKHADEPNDSSHADP